MSRVWCECLNGRDVVDRGMVCERVMNRMNDDKLIEASGYEEINSHELLYLDGKNYR